MRTIKFRVWDPKFNKFKYWGFMGEHEFKSPPIGFMSIKEVMEASEQLVDRLTDKNGNHPYVGDIIEITRNNSLNDYPPYAHKETVTLQTEVRPGDITSELIHWEIIGNIHESPNKI